MTIILLFADAKSLQSCPILCDPTDGSLPGSPVSGILQARTLEWVAISIPTKQSSKGKGQMHVAWALTETKKYNNPTENKV